MKTSPGKLSVVCSASYKISVLGFLNQDTVDRLGGLTIEKQEEDLESGKSITTLKGELKDQAALLGALNTLYNMRLPLLSIEFMGVSGKIED